MQVYELYLPHKFGLKTFTSHNKATSWYWEQEWMEQSSYSITSCTLSSFLLSVSLQSKWDVKSICGVSFVHSLLISLRPWKKKHRGCLVLSANKAIPDSGEVTGRSCTTEYDLGAICHNRCSCERRPHPPAKCQHLSKRNNICRQQQCNC